jgi:hypothetical protein
MTSQTTTQCKSITQPDVFGGYASVDRNFSDQPGQLEPLWTCRSWIEQQRVTEPFILRLMRMTKDTDVWSGTIEKSSSLFGQLSSFKYNMPDGDAETIQPDYSLCRKAALLIFIDIA